MSIDLLTNPWVEQEPCREEDPRFRAGKQTLLCRSFPQLPRRRPSRGEVNSSKYLAAEEAILHAEGAMQSSSVQWDDVWIEDIRACLSNEPDPAWSIWPAWKELVASAQPLHDTLRAIEISEFVSQSHEAGRPPPPETRIASAVPRSARTARLSRPPLWPTERMTPPVRAPLKHALCVANRPNVAVQAKPPLPWARKHFATSGGPKVTAGHQRLGVFFQCDIGLPGARGGAGLGLDASNYASSCNTTGVQARNETSLDVGHTKYMGRNYASTSFPITDCSACDGTSCFQRKASWRPCGAGSSTDDTRQRLSPLGQSLAFSALAESQRDRADLALECLAKERHLHRQREKALQEAQAALQEERLQRAEVEASRAVERKALQAAEQAELAEARRRMAAEAQVEQMKAKVKDLKKNLEDDESLRVLDEFRLKLESQRREISGLRRQLETAKEEAASKAALVEQGRVQLLDGQEKWAEERVRLVSHQYQQKQELLKAQADLAQLRQAGSELQAAAERIAEHSMRAAPVVATERERLASEAALNLAEVEARSKLYEQDAMQAREELVKMREEMVDAQAAGQSLQAAVDGMLQMCQMTEEWFQDLRERPDVDR
ncbi:G protein-activated inward rectifier potassium channel 4 [Durusdinium trenchii]|uniref:G protein-activated inward rectifier potassium channel 4 n=1 Tax=Durusdinium trenchii TaxID=1381693 RepID=A0ABP0PTD5_9DINO